MMHHDATIHNSSSIPSQYSPPIDAPFLFVEIPRSQGAARDRDDRGNRGPGGPGGPGPGGPGGG